jgi:hypothetical protein
MKTIAKSVIAVSIGLAAGGALAEPSVFPSSPNEAPAFSVPGPTRAERYTADTASSDRQASEAASANHRSSRFAPAWWRGGNPSQPPVGYPQEADG